MIRTRSTVPAGRRTSSVSPSITRVTMPLPVYASKPTGAAPAVEARSRSSVVAVTNPRTATLDSISKRRSTLSHASTSLPQTQARRFPVRRTNRHVRFGRLDSRAQLRFIVSVTVFALVSSAASCAVDLYLTRAAAEADLRDVERDDPSLAALLSIVPLDFGTVQQGARTDASRRRRPRRSLAYSRHSGRITVSRRRRVISAAPTFCPVLRRSSLRTAVATGSELRTTASERGDVARFAFHSSSI